MMTRLAIPLLITCPLALSLAPDHALEADDECTASYGDSCGLSAIQLRGVGVTSEEDLPEAPLPIPLDDMQDGDDEEGEEEKTVKVAKTTAVTEEAAGTTQAEAGTDTDMPAESKADDSADTATSNSTDATAGDVTSESAGNATVNSTEAVVTKNCALAASQQCGGASWTGDDCCVTGYLCVEINEYYFQCMTKAEKILQEFKATSSTTTTTTTNADPQRCLMPYQQCGGIIAGTEKPYLGPTCCTAGYYCDKVDKYYQMCKPSKSGGPHFMYEPTADLKAASEAPLHTFYVYRASSGEANEPTFNDNVNMANLPGALWYLHNEVVWQVPRKFNITRLTKKKDSNASNPATHRIGHELRCPLCV